MTQERLDLLLVVNVPDTHNSVLATRYKELTVWRDSMAHNLIEVTLNFPVELFSSEEELPLCLQVPYTSKLLSS